MRISDLFVPFEDELQLLPSKRVPNPPLIEWKSAFGDLFFRVKGMEPEVLWCDLGYTVTPKRPLPVNRNATLAKRVSRAFNGRTFFRVVPFEDGDDWVLVRPKRALVKSPQLQSVPALWSRGDNFAEGQKQLDWLSQPLEWFHNWLEWKANTDLDLEGARAFAPLDEEARAWAPFVGEEGARAKWEQLVPALQRLCLPSKASSHFVWQLDASTSPIGIFPHGLPARLKISRPARALLSILQKQWPLTFDFERQRSTDKRGQSKSVDFPRFIVQPMSPHERLEAALLWRGFGREIGKVDDVEAALRELLEAT